MKKGTIIFLMLLMVVKVSAFEAIEFGWASDTHAITITSGPPVIGECGTTPENNRRYDSAVISFSPCIGKIANIMQYFTDEASEFLIITGDVIYSATSEAETEAQWTRVLNCVDEFSLPVYFGFGNHDVAGLSTLSNILGHIGQRTRTEILTAYYSWDLKGYHFIILDLDYTSDGNYFVSSSARAYLPDAEASWLLADLTANKDKPTFVFAHQMAFSYTAEVGFPENTNGLVAILETYGNVQAYFNGHSHNSNYALQNGIRYYQTEAASDGCKFIPLVDLADDSSLTVTNEAGTIVSVDWTGAQDTEHTLSSGETFTIHGDSGLEGDYTATAGTTAAELHFDNGEEWAGSATPFDNEDYVENTDTSADTFEAYTKINISTAGVVTLTDPKDADNNDAWTEMSFTINMGRIKVTVDNTKVSGSEHHYNFPVLVTEDNMPDSFWDNVQSDGSDIYITSITGDAEWPRELIADTFDSSGKVMELWINMPALQFDIDTEFLIHYGGSGTYTNSTDTWNDDYAAVYHFNDSPAGGANSLVDSTINVVHGDPTGTMGAEDLVTGVVGKGWDFDSAQSDSVVLGSATELTSILDGAAGVTIETWVNFDDVTPIRMTSWIGINGSSGGAVMSMQSGPVIRAGGRSVGTDGFDTADATSTIIVNTTYHVAGVFDYPNDKLFIYLDGAIDNGVGGDATWTNEVYTEGTPTTAARIASNGLGTNETDGVIDEVRISTTIRSAGWIGTCFNNQDSPSTFYSAEVYVPVDTTGVPATGQLNGVIQ